MKFIKKWLGLEDQSKLIEEKFNVMQEKVIAEVAVLRAENYGLRTENNQKNARITELLGKLRDQNEADLFLEVKKIEKRILDGEKREDIDLSHLARLQAQSTYYQSNLFNQQGLGLLGGALGRFR